MTRAQLLTLIGITLVAIALAGGFFWHWQIKPSQNTITLEIPKETPAFVAPPEPTPQPEPQIETKKEEAPGTPFPFNPFGKITLTPDFFLDGQGTNIDSPEFFEADAPENTLLLISAKGNDLVEVWQFPFKDKELSPLKRNSLPNGLGIDQDRNLLLIGDADEQKVDVHSLPDLKRLSTLGENKLESGETNVDILTLPNGKKQAYVTETHGIDIFDVDGGSFIRSFSPNVESIEEVLADSFHQIIYVPEENGVVSKKYPGGALTAYYPDGRPYLRNGSNVFGKRVFAGDGEGVTLYPCRDKNGKDTGRGFILAADQGSGTNNGFEFFDRENWQHLGTLILAGVTLSDGITASNKPLSGYPDGLFAASNNDKNIAVISWEKISQVTRLQCL